MFITNIEAAIFLYKIYYLLCVNNWCVLLGYYPAILVNDSPKQQVRDIIFIAVQ